jgi:uncharacterized membrane protein YfcA
MALADTLLILAAGLAAGTINAVVGSGTLITFPTLLALGYGPVVANTSNNVGLVAGALSGTLGYRAELRGQRTRAIRLGAVSILGAAVGGACLLLLPSSAFSAIVPLFIGVALVLIVFHRRVTAFIERRQRSASAHGGRLVLAWVFLSGIYGGYFGAAQGIVLLAVLGAALNESMQRANALKNLLAGLNNATAAIAFIVFGPLDWQVVGLIAAGSLVGGQLGARVGRRLPDRVLRGIVVVVGSFAIVKLVAG